MFPVELAIQVYGLDINAPFVHLNLDCSAKTQDMFEDLPFFHPLKLERQLICGIIQNAANDFANKDVKPCEWEAVEIQCYELEPNLTNHAAKLLIAARLYCTQFSTRRSTPS